MKQTESKYAIIELENKNVFLFNNCDDIKTLIFHIKNSIVLVNSKIKKIDTEYELEGDKLLIAHTEIPKFKSDFLNSNEYPYEFEDKAFKNIRDIFKNKKEEYITSGYYLLKNTVHEKIYLEGFSIVKSENILLNKKIK